MTITLIIFGSLLAFAAIGSAISKLVKVPDVMAAMESVGVKQTKFPYLLFLRLLAALALLPVSGRQVLEPLLQSASLPTSQVRYFHI